MAPSANVPEVIGFAAQDPKNPANWSGRKKLFTAVTCILAITNSTISSSLPSGALSYFVDDFHVSDEEQLPLPVSLFLAGYVFGPVFFAPLSETYGRKIVILPSFIAYSAFTLGCALAPNWPSFLVFRVLVGVFASAPYTIVGGILADIYVTKLARGRAITTLLAFMNVGPVTGPIISAYASQNGWRWTFWISFIVCAVSLPLLILLPETHAPTILVWRARKLRQLEKGKVVVAPAELETKTFQETVTVVLIRPLRLLLEPITLLTCLFLALLFAIYYAFFEAYPLIFQDLYGLSVQQESLTFLPIGIGAALDTIVFLWYDWYLARAQKANLPWAHNEEYRRLPLACIGAPLYIMSLFWLGWTAKIQIHWIVPTLSGLTFGIGIELTFMALLNYLADAYTPYAASVMASSGITRSLFAVALPFAVKPMYHRLGIAWASTLLGVLALILGVAPFAFLRFGPELKRRSKLCQKFTAEQSLHDC